jgi:hypothetical protein
MFLRKNYPLKFPEIERIPGFLDLETVYHNSIYHFSTFNIVMSPGNIIESGGGEDFHLEMSGEHFRDQTGMILGASIDFQAITLHDNGNFLWHRSDYTTVFFSSLRAWKSLTGFDFYFLAGYYPVRKEPEVNMRTILAILFFVMLVAPLVPAARGGITLADTMEIDSQKLVLNGIALRKKLIFKVYVAGLYLPQKEKSGEQILKNDQSRIMIMHFLRSVDASKINDAWMDGLKANTSNPTQQLLQEFKRLCSWMEEMEDGQRLEFIYHPGRGTEVKVKDKVKGTIEGKPFADALLACWIGPNPGPGNSFKQDLLGVVE